MKRLLLLVLLFSSIGISADSKKSLTIKNLEVTVTGEYKVEIYKDMKHINENFGIGGRYAVLNHKSKTYGDWTETGIFVRRSF